MKKTNIKVILIVVCAVLLVAGGISAINGAGKDVGNQEAKNSAVSQTKDTVPVSVKTQAVAVQATKPAPTIEITPTPQLTVKATAKATPEPTVKPTPKPTKKATAKATPKPTAEVTAKATPKPTTKPTPKPTAKPTEKPKKESGGTVYWTPGGKKWHASKNCATLKRSKKIYSGSVSEAKSEGKNALCKVCG